MTPNAKIWLTALATMVLVSVSLTSCRDEEECRFDPQCDGGIGGLCHDDDECDDGFCCREDSNCGGGMCTYECHNDQECPESMSCEHNVCFFSCRSDRDCANGMQCEHGNTICEWP